MKRILLILVISLSIVSCKQSNEVLIKKEFKTYVKENFDDPKDFKEVVSVELIDTVYTSEIFDVVKYLYDYYFEIEDIHAKRSQGLQEITWNYLTPSVKEILTNAEQEELTYLTKKIGDSNKEMTDMKIEAEVAKVKIYLDNFKHQPPNYTYKIKFRGLNNNQLEVKEMFAHFDSLSHAIIFTFEQDNVPEEVVELSKYLHLGAARIETIDCLIIYLDRLHRKYNPKQIK